MKTLCVIFSVTLLLRTRGHRIALVYSIERGCNIVRVTVKNFFHMKCLYSLGTVQHSLYYIYMQHTVCWYCNVMSLHAPAGTSCAHICKHTHTHTHAHDPKQS